MRRQPFVRGVTLGSPVDDADQITYVAKDLRTGVVHYCDNTDAFSEYGATFCGITVIVRDFRNSKERVQCVRCLALDSMGY